MTQTTTAIPTMQMQAVTSPYLKRCRACDAWVFWLRSVRTGNYAPIDAAASLTGTMSINLRNGTYEKLSQRWERRPHKGLLHTNHLGVCTRAKLAVPGAGSGRETHEAQQ